MSRIPQAIYPGWVAAARPASATALALHPMEDLALPATMALPTLGVGEGTKWAVLAGVVGHLSLAVIPSHFRPPAADSVVSRWMKNSVAIPRPC